MSKEGKQAFLDAIAAARASSASTAPTDTLHTQGDEIDPYIEMIGGEFISHGAAAGGQADQSPTLSSPGAKAFGELVQLMTSGTRSRTSPTCT